MKKIIPFLLIILMMTGCTGRRGGDIKKSKFTKSETELLGELGYSEGVNLSSLDLDLSKLEVMEIATTIDYYKHGEFVETLVKVWDIADDEPLDIKNKRVTWSRKDVIEVDEKVHRELWTISLNGGYTSKRIEIPSGMALFGMRMNENFKGKIEKNKKYPLAMYTLKSGNSFMASDINFDDMDRTMENLKDYDGAYILYVEVK